MHRSPWVVPLVVVLTACDTHSPPQGAAGSSAPAASPTPSASATAPSASLADTLRASALSGSQALAHVRAIAALGTRLSGSPGDAAAVAWAVKVLGESGLANVHTEKVIVPHWERGEETASIVSPEKHELKIAALGGSTATPAGGLEADVIEVHSLAEIAKMDRAAVAGKIVFLSAPTRRTKDGSGYGEAVRGRFSGAREAQKLGAVAMLIRSVGTNGDRSPHTGAKSQDPVEIPAAALSPADSDLLHTVLSDKKKARIRLVLSPRSLPEAESANVVAEVSGAEKPDEVVVVGAHHDAWDLGPGATDDGAGCAIAIEVGRLSARMPRRPRRTIRVVLFANEENGIAGAVAYGKAHAAEAPKIVAALEADLGADRVYEVSFLGAADKRPAFVAIAQTLTSLGVAIADHDARGGTDVGPLRELGVPILDLSQDATRYFDFHHSANDTVDKVDEAALTQAVAAYTLAAWGVADAEGDLGRVPEDKRREIH